MIKRLIITLFGLAILFGGIFGWKWFVHRKVSQFMANRPVPAQVVQAEKAVTKTWHPNIASVGSLQAIQGVDVSSELAGVVTKIDFQSGQAVKKGSVLARLDTSTDEAQLRSLQAQAELASIQYKRQRELYRSRSTSRSSLDQAKAQYKQAQAQVAKEQATIGKKIIKAPFAGILGIRQVDLGQYVAPGTSIVTLQQLNPIYVNFNLPQQDLPKVHQGQSVHISVDGFGKTPFSGKITAINPKVNSNTRNFEIQATIDNHKHRLRPGMFVNAKIILPAEHNVVTVPETAISYNPYGDFVYVLKKTGNKRHGKTLYKAHRMVVQTGETRGDFVQITQGVKAGDLVVTAGTVKLHPGALAMLNQKNAPSYSATPKVSEQ